MDQETVRFWLGQKQVYGLSVARLDEEQLVSYRDRFYVVRGGAALLKRGKLVRFAPSSLPAKWKKAINGHQSKDKENSAGDLHRVPEPVQRPKRGFKTGAQNDSSELTQRSPAKVPELKTASEGDKTLPDTISEKEGHGGKPGKPKVKRREATGKPGKVGFSCPYCKSKCEIFPTGKNSKPFIFSCPKCKGDFAVRLVPITTYEVEIAAFSR